MVKLERSPSEALSARDAMPISANPALASLMPREEPPVWTSTRTPGCSDSKRLPISAASGATVLEPDNTSFRVSVLSGKGDHRVQDNHAARTGRLIKLSFFVTGIPTQLSFIQFIGGSGHSSDHRQQSFLHALLLLSFCKGNPYRRTDRHSFHSERTPPSKP